MLGNTNGGMSCSIKSSKYHIEIKPIGLPQFLKPKTAALDNDKRMTQNFKKMALKFSPQNPGGGRVYKCMQSDRLERKEFGGIQFMPGVLPRLEEQGSRKTQGWNLRWGQILLLSFASCVMLGILVTPSVSQMTKTSTSHVITKVRQCIQN